MEKRSYLQKKVQITNYRIVDHPIQLLTLSSSSSILRFPNGNISYTTWSGGHQKQPQQSQTSSFCCRRCHDGVGTFVEFWALKNIFFEENKLIVYNRFREINLMFLDLFLFSIIDPKSCQAMFFNNYLVDFGYYAHSIECLKLDLSKE